MKHIATAAFLLVCLIVGLLLGQYGLTHFHTKPGRTTPPEARPFEGPIPEVRGFQTRLGLEAPISKWEEQARHDADLGATWLAVNARVESFSGPQAAVVLGAISKVAHDSHLKIILVADISEPVEYAPKAQVPPDVSMKMVEPMLAAAMAGGVDVIALDSGLGEREPDDAAWATFIAQIKDRCKIPLCYIADWAAAPRVSWWTQVDYVGVRGPITLTDRDDFNLHNLQMSYRSRQDLIKYLNLRDHVPVLFFDVSYEGGGQRSVLSYQAAVTNARGQTNTWIDQEGTPETRAWLAGMFLRLPDDPGAAGPVEAMLKGEWK